MEETKTKRGPGKPVDGGRGLFHGSHSTNLSSTTARASLAQTANMYDPPPEGIVFEPFRISPPANVAFTAAELDERIKGYAARVEAGLCLFEDAPAPVETPADVRACCWGCGRPTPANPEKRGSRISAGKCPGWRVLPIPGLVGASHVSTWCPACVAMGGFGCVEELELPAVRKAVSL